MEKNYKNKTLREIADLEKIICDAETYYVFEEEKFSDLLYDVLSEIFEDKTINESLIGEMLYEMRTFLEKNTANYYFYKIEELERIANSLVNVKLNLEEIRIDFKGLNEKAENREKKYNDSKKDKLMLAFNQWKKEIEKLLEKTGMEIIYSENCNYAELIEIYDVLNNGGNIDDLFDKKHYGDFIEEMLEAMKNYSYETKEYKNDKLFGNKKILYIK